MTPLVQCYVCRHYLGKSKCNAFPEGIPDVILEFKVDHRKPYSGDHGIQFEPKESES